MKTYLSHRDGCVDEVVLLSDLLPHMLKVKEVVNSIRLPIGVRHKLPCECICCESNARIDEALRLIGEVL